KRRYAEAELTRTRLAEPLAALARRASGRDRRPLLELAWRGLVRCQFHDSIAGCVSDVVARALEARLGGVEALASEIVRGSVHDLAHHDPDAARARPADAQPTLVLWNPAARPRRGVALADVTLFRRDVLVGPPGGRVPRMGEGYRPLMLATADGRAIPVQVLDRRIAGGRCTIGAAGNGLRIYCGSKTAATPATPTATARRRATAWRAPPGPSRCGGSPPARSLPRLRPRSRCAPGTASRRDVAQTASRRVVPGACACGSL